MATKKNTVPYVLRAERIVVYDDKSTHIHYTYKHILIICYQLSHRKYMYTMWKLPPSGSGDGHISFLWHPCLSTLDLMFELEKRVEVLFMSLFCH